MKGELGTGLEKLEKNPDRGKELKPSFFDNLQCEPSESQVEHKGIQNKIDGCRRENEVEQELVEKYPESEGYSIVKEAYLRDKEGSIMKDEQTGEARRIDFVIVKEGKVVDAVEVTSKTADKVSQIAKEYRIREQGGNYIKDNEGNLVRMPNNVETRIERRA